MKRSMQVSSIALLALLGAVAASVQSVHAATITVTSTADSGTNTLREALANAANGDTINFTVATPATITLTTGQLLVSNSVTILGPGSANLAVNGNAASRVFNITNAVTVVITGLTVTNGLVSADAGGGIYNDSSTLTVSNCTISGNSAGDGGGIFSDGFSGSATLKVTDSTISGNSATSGNGGGIYNDG